MRRTAGVVAFLLVATLGVWTHSGGSARAAKEPLPPAELGPLVSGTSSVVDGTYVWTDYAYDDTGASYPQDKRNAADLIQLQLTREPGGVRVRAVLETLTDASVPRLVLGFDTDGNANTGEAALPGLSWQPQRPLGVDVVASDFTADAARNTLEGFVPVDPHGATWRTFAAVGLNSQPDTFDLAFNREETAGWQDANQQAVLGGTADPNEASDVVDFSANGTRLADIRSPGFHTLLYRSALTLGEGIGQVTAHGPGGTPVPLGDMYAGPYQPYITWVPPALPESPAVVLFMHGFTGNHTGMADSVGPGKFEPAAVVVMPLGRGGNSFYLGAGEQDVLDATDDAVSRYAGDPERVVVSGISMGGFGTFRLAVRYPDRFAAALSLIGTGASGQDVFAPVPAAVRDQIFSPSHFLGGQSELLANVANLPFRMVNGQVDPIVNNALVTLDAIKLDDFGYDWRYWVLMRRNHEVVPNLTNCVMDEVVSKRRDTNPARVVYSVEPSTFYIDPDAGLALVYDKAYWVSGLTVRDASTAGAMGTIDVTSLARADRVRTATKSSGVGENVSHGADLCGDNDAVKTNDVWRMQNTTVAAGAAQPTSNGLVMTLTRLTAATFDLSRAGVQVDEPVKVDVTGDGPSTLRFTAPWKRSVDIERDGQVVDTVTPSDGVVTVVGDFSGQHVLRLIPR